MNLPNPKPANRSKKTPKHALKSVGQARDSSIPFAARRKDKFSNSSHSNIAELRALETPDVSDSSAIENVEQERCASVNWYCQLVDAKMNAEFRSFTRVRMWPKFLSLLVLMVTVSLWPVALHDLYTYFGHVPIGTWVVILSRFLFTTSTVAIGWTVLAMHRWHVLSRLWAQVVEKTKACTSKFFNNSSVSTPSTANGLLNSGNSSSLFRTVRRQVQEACQRDQLSLQLASNRIAPQPNVDSRRTSKSSPVSASVKPVGQPGSKWFHNIWESIVVSIVRPHLLNSLFLLFFQFTLIFFFIQNVLLTPVQRTSAMGFFLSSPLQISIEESDNVFVVFWCAVLFVAPFCVLQSLPDVPILYIWSVLWLSFVVFVSVIVYQEYTASWLLVVFVMLSICCLVVDHQLHKIEFFLASLALREILVEKEKSAEEEQVQEMRHMIANVAHDLKTPLSSFMSGIEYVELALRDCQKPSLLMSPSNCENYEAIGSCLSNIRNTHAFMLMTINRCIDYTKASKGMKLVPKLETIHFLESIELPLSCMMTIQNRIDIVVDPIASRLCPYLITDKQWLQENVLCLLSNAVKYSLEGQVHVSISLEEYYAEPFRDIVMDSEATVRREEPTESCRVFSVYSSRNSVMSAEMMQSDCSNPNVLPQLTPFVRIEVEDTGIGMNEDAMMQLFKPFKQNQRLAGGTGLGLFSLAKRLEALNGFYGVMKRRDGARGCNFWFAFPYRPDFPYAKHMLQTTPSAGSIVPRFLHQFKTSFKGQRSRLTSNDSSPSKDVTKPVPPTQTPSSIEDESNLLRSAVPPAHLKKGTVCGVNPETEPSRKLSILLVDDSPSILKMSAMMLKRLGHIITTAENGAAALELVVQKSAESSVAFDVVFMDLQMPVMDGLEAIRRIRENESTRDIDDAMLENAMVDGHLVASFHQKIIGMSANSDHETMTAAMHAGADLFIAKPFNLEAVRSAFEKLSLDLKT